MIVEYGMGKTLGLSTNPRQRGPVFLPTEHGYGGGRDFSDETASRIDAEAREILDQRHQHVMEMLTERRDTLATIAELLLDKEVLLEEEFIRLVKEG
jgi:cell division protease FtsH